MLLCFLTQGSFLLVGLISEADSRGGAGDALPPPPHPPNIFCNRIVFCNNFEELQTELFKVERIVNNAPLTYVSPNTIETCLTPNH